MFNQQLEKELTTHNSLLEKEISMHRSLMEKQIEYNKELEERCMNLVNENNRLNNELTQVYSSTSWKITWIMRKFKLIIKRVFSRKYYS